MIRLLCTFTQETNIQDTIDLIESNYNIFNNKIFILRMSKTSELACTYNIESGNLKDLLDNTIAIHRHKETNTLYTINALNDLIKSLNGGVLDTSYTINWKDYQNCILLTHAGELRRLDTKIYKIISL